LRRPATDTATMIGKRYNRLTVLSEAPAKKLRIMILCRCECGTEKVIEARQVLNGKTKSCSCLHSDISRTTYRKRNFVRTRTNPLDAIDEDIVG
jgi:hypothetical protein